MAKKMIGKDANRLREAHGQFSSQFHKPFLIKCLYKDTVPENMADPPKKIGKIKKRCRIASFHWGQHVHHNSNNIIKQFPHKKILTFNLHNCIPTDGKGEEQAKYHNVPQFALLRMIIVAWPAFSASKRILLRIVTEGERWWIDLREWVGNWGLFICFQECAQTISKTYK